MTDPNQAAKYRLRLTFSKKKTIKYISHLDLALAWERALRRAQIPLVYSQGFNPRPKLQVASGLPLGTAGRAEILDIIISNPISPEEALERIRPTLPAGIELHTVEATPLKSPSLQHLLRQAEYRVTVETELSAEAVTQRVNDLLAADEITQIRRRRKRDEEIDLRPWLHELRIEAIDDGEVQLHMRLTAGQFGNLRPEAVLEALDLADNWHSIERIKLIFEDDLPSP